MFIGVDKYEKYLLYSILQTKKAHLSMSLKFEKRSGRGSNPRPHA